MPIAYSFCDCDIAQIHPRTCLDCHQKPRRFVEPQPHHAEIAQDPVRFAAWRVGFELFIYMASFAYHVFFWGKMMFYGASFYFCFFCGVWCGFILLGPGQKKVSGPDRRSWENAWARGWLSSTSLQTSHAQAISVTTRGQEALAIHGAQLEVVSHSFLHGIWLTGLAWHGTCHWQNYVKSNNEMMENDANQTLH